MTKITSTSKRMMSLILALLMMASCMAFASADTPETETETTTTTTVVTPGTTLTVPKPELSLNKEDKFIVVKAIDPIVANGKSYPVEFSISPKATKGLHENGVDTIFFGLTMGKKYTVTATIIVDGSAITSSDSITLKNEQSAPEIKAATNVTSDSIEIPRVTGCVYKIEKEGTSNDKWGNVTKFTDLTPDTLYTISIKFKETDTKYESPETKLTVRTLMVAKPGKPAAPTLKDKNMDTIIVEEKSGIEYSIDLKNWQKSGTFTGLKAGVTYSIYARYEFDPGEQEAGEASAPLVVVTNKKATSPATLNDCKITIEQKEVYYANQTFAVDIEVKSTFVTHKAEYGDTVYIPISYQVNDGTKQTIKRVQGAKFEADVHPETKNANTTIKLTINFTKMKYVGGTTWIDIGEETSSVHKVVIGPEYTLFNRFVEVMAKAFNFLFDTAPGMLADFLNSDVVEDYFNLIFGLGDGSFGDIDLGGLLGSLGGTGQK